MNTEQVIKKLEMAAAHYELAAKETTMAVTLLRQGVSTPSPSKKKKGLSDTKRAALIAKLDKKFFQ